MKTLIRLFGILAAISPLIGGCGSLPALLGREEQAMPNTTLHAQVLGKPLTDTFVAGFIASSHCSDAGQIQVCKEVGMDLWIDASQIVTTVYLYLNNQDGYSAYRGELPLGLRFYDIQGAVEYKLKRQGVGNEGLPDEGSSPDHFHYWAFYNQQNMIIIYNSPFPDEDATIYAIVISDAETMLGRSGEESHLRGSLTNQATP
jgi:hypothetical protein